MKQKGKIVSAVCALLLFLPQAHAADPPVRIHVTVLQASNEGKDINLENDAYRDQLIKLFSYTSYNQMGSSNVELAAKGDKIIRLPAGYTLTLTLQSAETQRVMIRAVVTGGPKEYVNTSLAIMRPGVVFLGGPPLAPGVLIIGLEAVS